MAKHLVSINLVVYNESKYIRHCLSAVFKQTYSNYEVRILDNASTDDTAKIIEAEFPRAILKRGVANVGMWPGQELLLPETRGVHILVLSADVILAPNYVENAVVRLESDRNIGSVQAKMLQWRFGVNGEPEFSKTIDTLGFQLTRARRLINKAHGEMDHGQYEQAGEIFGVEGAAPFFRRQALECCRIEGHITDPDYFWYGDDLDLAWRLTLFGWRQMYDPTVTAYHQRSTTTAMAHNLGEHISRIGIRGRIPIRKRRLDWSNTRFTILKNDYIINILRDAPYILLREAAVLIYTILFEPTVLFEGFRFLHLLPRMLWRRRLVMNSAKVDARVVHSFFIKAPL